MRGAVGWVALLVLLTGVTGCDGASSGAAAVTTAAPPGDLGTAPPAVTVRNGDQEVDLSPITSCWSSSADPAGGTVTGCVDGSPPESLVDLGAGDELTVSFPVPGWEFTATLNPYEQPCGPSQTVSLDRVGEHEHRLVPTGRAGTYDVDLSGRGPEGDVTMSARWTTTVNGPAPPPTAAPC